MEEKRWTAANKSVIKNMQRRKTEFNSDLNMPILIHKEHDTKGSQLMGALSEVTLLVFAYLGKVFCLLFKDIVVWHMAR